jgi:acetyltransferase-like isoleucine patch superfamily enzyme
MGIEALPYNGASKRRFAARFTSACALLAQYAFNNIITYVPVRRLRQTFFSWNAAECGTEVVLLLGVQVRNGSNVFVGDRVVLNRNVLIDGRGGRVQIENDVDIGQDTNIWTLEHDVHSDSHATQGGDVFIGDHVWVSSRATILPGTRVGRGAVVACGSVVTKDVPALAIVGGVPAKVIGQRRNSLTYQLHYNPRFQ